MKTSRNIISVLVAAGAPGVALLALGNVIATDAALAVLTVGSLLAFAAFDYSRPSRSLPLRTAVLRPALQSARIVAPVTCIALDRAA